MGFSHYYGVKQKKGLPSKETLENVLVEILPLIEKALEKYGEDIADGHGTPGSKPNFNHDKNNDPFFAFNGIEDEDACETVCVCFEESEYRNGEYRFFTKTNRGNYDIPALESLFILKREFAKRKISMSFSSDGLSVGDENIKSLDDINTSYDREMIEKFRIACAFASDSSTLEMTYTPRRTNPIPWEIRQSCEKTRAEPRALRQFLKKIGDYFIENSDSHFIPTTGGPLLPSPNGTGTNIELFREVLEKWKEMVIQKSEGMVRKPTISTLVEKIPFPIFQYGDITIENVSKNGTRKYFAGKKLTGDDPPHLRVIFPPLSKSEALNKIGEFYPRIKAEEEKNSLMAKIEKPPARKKRNGGKQNVI